MNEEKNFRKAVALQGLGKRVGASIVGFLFLLKTAQTEKIASQRTSFLVGKPP